MHLKTLRVKDFRGFRELEIGGLQRVNVFTGPNGVGKTSLLEAAFLLSAGANPALALALHNFRGESVVSPEVDRPLRSLLRDLQIAPATISGQANGQTRTLTIKPLPSTVIAPSATQTLKGLQFSLTIGTRVYSTRIEWETIAGGFAGQGVPQVQARLHIDPPPPEATINGYFSSPYYTDIWPQAHRLLTDLTKAGRVHEAVDALKCVQPNLNNLFPLQEGGAPVIYADIGASNLIPVNILGSGFINVMHLTLDALSASGGLLFIDEIEDGLHHTAVVPLINFLLDICTSRSIQAFVATHSDSILRVFAHSAKQKKDSTLLALFRLVQKGSAVAATRYDPTEIEQLESMDADLF